MTKRTIIIAEAGVNHNGDLIYKDCLRGYLVNSDWLAGEQFNSNGNDKMTASRVKTICIFTGRLL